MTKKYPNSPELWAIEQSKVDFVQEIDAASDRAAAIMAAAFLEEKLSDAIRNRLVNDKDQSNRLLKHNGPIGSLANKNLLAYLLGMYQKTIYEDIAIIGDIRNLFAHKPIKIDFNSRDTRQLCEKMHYNLLIVNIDETGANIGNISPRNRYLGAIKRIIFHLWLTSRPHRPAVQLIFWHSPSPDKS